MSEIVVARRCMRCRGLICQVEAELERERVEEAAGKVRPIQIDLKDEFHYISKFSDDEKDEQFSEAVANMLYNTEKLKEVVSELLNKLASDGFGEAIRKNKDTLTGRIAIPMIKIAIASAGASQLIQGAVDAIREEYLGSIDKLFVQVVERSCEDCIFAMELEGFKWGFMEFFRSAVFKMRFAMHADAYLSQKHDPVLVDFVISVIGDRPMHILSQTYFKLFGLYRQQKGR